MEAERWQRMKDLFEAAMDLPSEERAAFVDRSLPDDEELAITLRRMLDAEKSPTEIFDTPALDWLRGPEENADALIGSRIGELNIEARIASGGMSNVYRAREDGTSGSVAIKLMKQGLDSVEARRRFELEARSLASLRHPNIVELLRTEFLSDGRPGLVMELVEGESIERFCSTCSLDAILELFLQVCAAVQHAHGKLLVHRDLKPANILVQGDGQVKVLDFGVVKLLAPREDDPSTQLGALVPLTPRYASPEQRRGEAVSTASDVYSLGVILDELLQRFALSSGHDLRRIIAKCRQEDPELRYGSVDLLAEDLGRYRRGEPIRIRSASISYRLSKFVGRNRWGVGVSALLLVGLLITLFFLYGQWRATQDAEGLAWRAHSQALQ
ncbi:MAG: serine/threonine protein kinase, partial [Planctomycetota bacterium]